MLTWKNAGLLNQSYQWMTAENKLINQSMFFECNC